MSTIDKLTEYFMKFPHIGSRQAKRLVYFILSEHPSFAEELGTVLLSVKDSVRQCARCRRFFPHTKKGDDTLALLCAICAHPNTDTTLLMVVEKDADLEAVRKSGAFKGRFFVLGGTVPLVMKHMPESVRLKELFEEVRRALKENGLSEVILAFSTDTEGDHTASHIAEILRPLQSAKPFTLSSLGRGLSTGAELEYSDSDTLEHALVNRKRE